MTLIEAIKAIGKIAIDTIKVVIDGIGNMNLRTTVNAGIIVGTATVVCYSAYRYVKARLVYIKNPKNMSPVDKALAINNMDYKNDKELKEHMKTVKKELYGDHKKSASKRRKKRMKARELRERLEREFSDIHDSDEFSFGENNSSKKSKRPTWIDATKFGEPYKDPEYEAMYDYGMKKGGLFRQAIESGRIPAANC